MKTPDQLADEALRIWQAGVDAVRPAAMMRAALQQLTADVKAEIEAAPRLLVVGGGKASAEMAAALEAELHDSLAKFSGIVNVPESAVRALKKITLNAARPDGVNFPTEDGFRGSEEMLKLLATAGPNDVALCLISGGGSALLPAPVPGVTLDDKLAVTKLLHASGATIGEMNAVRKHLSRIKGGRLAEAFTGKRLISFIVSDVVGDPLDVIASGPTAADPTTFQDAVAILERYQLLDRAPASVRNHLELGASGTIPETPKAVPAHTINTIIGSNAIALNAAAEAARGFGYSVLDIGPFIEGETTEVATVIAGIVRNIRERNLPITPPACILLGGETTVSLPADAGKGGRNQEFVLAMMLKLGFQQMQGIAVLSAGTDGEDGPTDAAGAVATTSTWVHAATLQLKPEEYLARHDAYPFLNATQALIRSGLTGTNVMDVRVILVDHLA